MLRLWNRLTTILLLGAAVAIGLAACVTIADVVGRYLFRISIQGAIEVSALFVGLGAVLSMPICFTNAENVSAVLIRDFVARPVVVVLNLLAGVSSLIFIALLTWIEWTDLARNFGGFRVLPDSGFPYDKAILVITAGFMLTTVGAVFGLVSLICKDRT